MKNKRSLKKASKKSFWIICITVLCALLLTFLIFNLFNSGLFEKAFKIITTGKASITETNALDYYVSSVRGDDSFLGTTSDKPWRTLDKVKNAWDSGSILPGDTIHLEKGSVFNSKGWNISRGGSLGKYITLRGDDFGSGAKPVFNVVDGDFGFQISKGSYIRLQGFTIDGRNRGIGAGILLGGGDSIGSISNVQILNMEIRNIANSYAPYSCGIQVTSSKGYTISNSLIEGNDISGYSAHGINHYPDKQKGNLHINITYRDNYIHNPATKRYSSAAAGIQIGSGGSGNVFEYNTVEGPNPDGQIFVFDSSDNEDNIVIRYNTLRNNSVGNGIWLHKHDDAVPNLAYGVSIYGNLISGNYKAGIYVGGGDNLTLTARVYNNIFYNNDRQTSYSSTYDVGGELYLHGYNTYKVYFKNNILYHLSNGAKNYDVGINDKFLQSNIFEHSNNLYWHSSGSNGVAMYDARTGSSYTVANIKSYEPSAQNTNPLFTDFNSLKSGQNSPVINNGDNSVGDSYKISRDNNNRNVNSPWDIGAYEYPKNMSNITCFSNADCNDLKFCTTDVCINPGLNTSYCTYDLSLCGEICSDNPIISPCMCSGISVTSGFCCSDNYQQLPCSSAAVIIPGKLQAEGFSSYKDLNTLANEQNPEGVDLASCGTDCYYIIDTQPGEWLEYTILLDKSGYYKINAYIASGAIGTKKLHITLDGKTVYSLRSDGYSTWLNWKKFSSIGFRITAGTHKVRIYFDTGNINMNYLRILAVK